MLIKNVSTKRPCIYYFQEYELKYDLSELKDYPPPYKELNDTFFENTTRKILSGTYIINICLDQQISNICRVPNKADPPKQEDYIFYFKPDLSDCYEPLISSSFDEVIFDVDKSNLKGGFSIGNIEGRSNQLSQLSMKNFKISDSPQNAKAKWNIHYSKSFMVKYFISCLPNIRL